MKSKLFLMLFVFVATAAHAVNVNPDRSNDGAPDMTVSGDDYLMFPFTFYGGDF